MDTMEMHKHEVARTAKTMVWWNIDSCPVPDGFDAHLIGPCIESALKNSGYAGPLTITAIGNLKRTLKHTPDVLPAIFSSGIVLKHAPCETDLITDLIEWTRDNQPPANLMVISGGEEQFTRVLLNMREWGYTILQAYPQVYSKAFSSVPTSKEWLWKTLLEDDSRETETHELQEKYRETDKYFWFCMVCRYFPGQSIDSSFAGQSFEDFTTHLKSDEHKLGEFDMVNIPVCRDMGNCGSKLTLVDTFEEFESEAEKKDWDRWSF